MKLNLIDMMCYVICYQSDHKMMYNLNRQRALQNFWDSYQKLLKKMFSLIEKYGITNSVSSHCWDSCHNYILKQTRNHLTQCFSIFFSAPTYLKDKYNISNGGFLYQGFSRVVHKLFKFPETFSGVSCDQNCLHSNSKAFSSTFYIVWA